MYQPFVVGSEGRNIILEVTRIPNVPEIYNRFIPTIQMYKVGSSTDYKGSTCNVAYCGSNFVLNWGRKYRHSVPRE